MTVGAVRAPVQHMLKCWACAHQHEPARGVPRWRVQLLRYELLVEAAERLREFSTAELWRAVGGGPANSSMASRVITDLRLHGLLACVYRKGDRCLRWRLTRGS